MNLFSPIFAGFRKAYDPMGPVGPTPFLRLDTADYNLADGATVSSLALAIGGTGEQPTESKQPKFKNTGGEKYLSFDGTDDGLELPAQSYGTAMTIVLVERKKPRTTYNRTLQASGANFVFNTDNGGAELFYSNTGIAFGSHMAGETKAIAIGTINSLADEASFRLNGVERSYTNTCRTIPTRISIGMTSYANQNPAETELFLLEFYAGVLTLEQRQAIEAANIARFGI